ncbi:MAG: 50S ribosomal protein L15 [Sphingomonas sp.]|nr:MAG: 50S ribosomal protein L15 [Sphingomonas sp.]
MTKLNEINDNPGARVDRVRVGRGIGSGLGKTSGRGQKGQKSRSGVAIKGFEGGQMPLHMRLPKRGFNKPNRVEYSEVNIGALQRAVEAGRLDASKPVDLAALQAAGLVTQPKDGVRLLGKGELKTKLDLHVAGVTGSAKAAVEAAGGSITLPAKKVAAEA